MDDTRPARTAAASPAPTIRVVLADDHPALRMGLRVLLEQSPPGHAPAGEAPRIAVVAEAGDGKEALAQIEALRPDVAVLDCLLPEMTGAEVAVAVRRQGLPARVLALSAYSDERYVHAMLAAGCAGYLLKEEAPAAIVGAVRAAARGEEWFSPGVAARVAAWKRGERPAQTELTERELAVLRLVAKGRSNKEIARALNVTDRTVEFHVSNVLSKLGLSSRVEAAVWATDHGLGD